MNCCPPLSTVPPDVPSPGPIPEVVSNMGIIVGQLLDRAMELMEQHLSCPYAEVYDLGKDGTVRIQARSTSMVELKDDPIQLLRLERERGVEEDMRKTELRNIEQSRANACMQAKCYGMIPIRDFEGYLYLLC